MQRPQTHQFYLINVLLGFGDIFVPYDQMEFGFWKIQSGYSSLVPNPPISGNTDTSREVIQETVVMNRRSGREFRYYGDAIYNIWSKGDIKIHYFSKYCSVIEIVLFLKVFS